MISGASNIKARARKRDVLFGDSLDGVWSVVIGWRGFGRDSMLASNSLVFCRRLILVAFRSLAIWQNGIEDHLAKRQRAVRDRIQGLRHSDGLQLYHRSHFPLECQLTSSFPQPARL